MKLQFQISLYWNLYFQCIIKNICTFAMASVAPSVGAAVDELKGHRFASWSGDKPRWRVRSSGGAHARSNQLMFLSHIMCVSLSSPLAKNQLACPWVRSKSKRRGRPRNLVPILIIFNYYYFSKYHKVVIKAKQIFFSAVAGVVLDWGAANTTVRYSRPRNRLINVALSTWQRYPGNLMEERKSFQLKLWDKRLSICEKKKSTFPLPHEK